MEYGESHGAKRNARHPHAGHRRRALEHRRDAALRGDHRLPRDQFERVEAPSNFREQVLNTFKGQKQFLGGALETLAMSCLSMPSPALHQRRRPTARRRERRRGRARALSYAARRPRSPMKSGRKPSVARPRYQVPNAPNSVPQARLCGAFLARPRTAGGRDHRELRRGPWTRFGACATRVRSRRRKRQ